MATLNIQYYDTYSLSIDLTKCDTPKGENMFKMRLTQNDTTERKSSISHVEYFLTKDQLSDISKFIMEQSNDE